MSHVTDGSVCRQIEQAWQRLDDEKALPFSNLLPAELVDEALGEARGKFRNRIFNTVTTLWTFLSQAISEDGSCRKAVARFLAWRVARGLPACSADNSAYCKARSRLPTSAVKWLVRRTGEGLEETAERLWLWKGRGVKVVDGTTVTTADTPENQAAYPQRQNQKHGVGFPIARLVVIFSLATASALDLVLGPTKGKKTGETTLFRSMLHNFQPGEIVLGDRLFDSYLHIAQLRQQGVDVLFRRHATRHCDFRRGRWLGTLDHVVVWKKPPFNRNRFDRETYDALPDQMEIRELRFRVQEKGFRPHEIVLVTTLLDAQVYPKEELAELYRERWHSELDLRALKTTLKIDHLRCKTPEMVEKELWVHFLAYNLIRQTIAAAARRHDRLPRRLSFKGALQTLDSFAPYLAVCPPHDRERLSSELLAAIATHHVGDRPNRVEPRKLKQRHAKYTYLTQPRALEKQRLTT